MVVLYVMTYDVTRPLPDQPYRLTLGNLPPGLSAQRFYDPLPDRELPSTGTVSATGELTLEVMVSDTPRLLALKRNP